LYRSCRFRTPRLSLSATASSTSVYRLGAAVLPLMLLQDLTSAF